MELIEIKATDLRVQTRDLMERVKFKGERFVVATFGRPMAVLISIEDFERVRQFLIESPDGADVGHSPPASIANRKSRRGKIRPRRRMRSHQA